MADDADLFADIPVQSKGGGLFDDIPAAKPAAQDDLFADIPALKKSEGAPPVAGYENVAAGYRAQAESEASAPPAPGERGAIARSFVNTVVSQNPQMMAEAVEALGLATDSPDLAKAGTEWSAKAKGWSRGGPEPIPFSEVWVKGDLGKTAERFFTAVGESIGQAIGSSLPPAAGGILAGGATFAATRSPRAAGAAGLLGGAAGPGYALNLGDVYTGLKEDEGVKAKLASGELSPKALAQVAALGAVPVSALDLVSLDMMTKPLTGALTGQAKKAVRDTTVKYIASHLAKSGATEGLTEGLQDAISQTLQAYVGDTDLLTIKRMWSVVDNALGGFFGGAAIGGGSAAASRLTSSAPAQATGETGQTQQASPPPAPGAPVQPAPGAQVVTLSQEDIDSPIPNDVLLAGRQTLANAEAAQAAGEILKAAGLPDVGARVNVKYPDGREIGAQIEGAHETTAAGQTARGVRLKLDNGQTLEEFFDTLRDAGVSITPAPAATVTRGTMPSPSGSDVSVKQSADDQGVQPLRGSASAEPPLVQGLPSGPDAGVASGEPAAAGAAGEGERQGVRRGLLAEGEDRAGELPGVREPGRADAPSGLQSTVGDRVDVPGLPSGGAQDGRGADSGRAESDARKDLEPQPAPVGKPVAEGVIATVDSRGVEQQRDEQTGQYVTPVEPEAPPSSTRGVAEDPRGGWKATTSTGTVFRGENGRPFSGREQAQAFLDRTDPLKAAEPAMPKQDALKAKNAQRTFEAQEKIAAESASDLPAGYGFKMERQDGDSFLMLTLPDGVSVTVSGNVRGMDAPEFRQVIADATKTARERADKALDAGPAEAAARNPTEPPAWFSGLTRAGREQLAKKAGYSDGDAQRLSLMNWVNLARRPKDVERLAAASQPAAETQKPNENPAGSSPGVSPAQAARRKEWREVGKNAAGEAVYEDAQGVRSVVEDGVRQTESVGLHPTREGLQLSTQRVPGGRYRLTTESTETPKDFWSYKAPDTPRYEDLPAGAFGGTKEGWEQLSPGMRREIVRSFKKDQERGASGASDITPTSVNIPAPPPSRDDFLKAVSKATKLKGVEVYEYGEGASYDPLLRLLTVGENVQAGEESIAQVAALTRASAPEGWGDVEVEATAEDGATGKVAAKVAAGELAARIKRALAVLKCLG